MNILSMFNRDDLWDDSTIKYVGRSKNALGLGNPWSHLNARQARFYVSTPQAALDAYRYWLLKKLIPHYLSGMRFVGIEDWEKEYLSKVIQLSVHIKAGKYTSLGCWCINIQNYLLVPDGYEKCHAEILYKACLQLIEQRRNNETILLY
ncbi:DUF4326 domain-containing protein [uncultured Nostoc sp.]|uniref:DUF4326 domain-containing protein n=1 Tax=uncultured Nostoc sp. TaxID=340711 RepID=UPI0035CBF455